MAEIKKNEIYEVRIEDMGHDGAGIGKIDGYPLFVKDALIGDVAEVKIIKAKKNYAYARLMHLITLSPHRVTPRCPVARQCGGCQIQALDYGQQLLFEKAHGGKQSAPDRRSDETWRYCRCWAWTCPTDTGIKPSSPLARTVEGNPVAGFYAGTHPQHSSRAATVCWEKKSTRRYCPSYWIT